MEQPRLLRFGTNLVPSWKKAFLCISVSQPGSFVARQTSTVPAAGSSLPPRPCIKQHGVYGGISETCLPRPLSYLVGTGIF